MISTSLTGRLLAVALVLTPSLFLIDESVKAQSVAVRNQSESLRIPRNSYIERQTRVSQRETILVVVEEKEGLTVSIFNSQDSSVSDGTDGVILAPPSTTTYRIRLSNGTGRPISTSLRVQSIN